MRKVSELPVAMIWVNQIRQKIGGMAFAKKTETVGGLAVKFASSVRMQCNVRRQLKRGTRVTGLLIKTKTFKNRVAPPLQSCEWVLDFKYGPSPELTMLEHLIIDKKIKVAGGGLWSPVWSDEKFLKKDFVDLCRENPKFLAETTEVYKSYLAGLDAIEEEDDDDDDDE